MEEIILFGACIISMIVYILRQIDNTSIVEKGMGYLIRKSIIGSIGCMISVNITFHTLIYFSFPFNLSIAIASGVGYLGADTMTLLAEKFLSQLIDKYTKK